MQHPFHINFTFLRFYDIMAANSEIGFGAVEKPKNIRCESIVKLHIGALHRCSPIIVGVPLVI